MSTSRSTSRFACGAVNAARLENALRNAEFEPDLVGAVRTALDDLLANFTNPGDQGPAAYTEQMLNDHPDLDPATVAADAVLASGPFTADCSAVPTLRSRSSAAPQRRRV